MNPLSSICSDCLQEQPRLYDRNDQILRDQQAAAVPYPVRAPEQEASAGAGDKPAAGSSGMEDRWSPGEEQHDGVGGAYSRLSLLCRPLLQDAETADAGGVTSDEADQVERLRQRDSEVRRHEQAHAAALGAYAGVISYTYQIGPDGKAYAIGGATVVRPPGGNSPEQRAAWGRTVRNAAFAAGEPSAADVAVAADATRMQNIMCPGFSVIA